MPVLEDGFSTIYTFALAPVVKFAEKTVTPPGFDGGGPNDVTTMRNEEWRTMAPKKLKTLTEAGASCAYDPAFIEDVNDMINVNQLITVTFPDGSSWDFWGYLDKFTPGEHQEGEQPEADVVIQPTNRDASGNEVAPVYHAPA